MKKVFYAFPTSHHYRLPFHKSLRELLRQQGVEYRVIYCDPSEENRKKADAVDVEFGIKVGLTTFFGQAVLSACIQASDAFRPNHNSTRKSVAF